MMNPQMMAMMQQMAGQRMAAAEPLVKINAGKMTSKPSTITPGKFTITPLPEKGQLQIVKDEQGIVKFQWKSRISDNVDQTCDHMVFPGDAKFEKVNTGREGDRVYMLQFTANTSRRWFFWLQHKKDEDDAEVAKKFNDALSGVDISAAADGDAATADEATAASGAAAAAVPFSAAASTGGAGSAVSMAQVLSALGLPPAPTDGAAAATAVAGSSPSAGAISSADLQRALDAAAGGGGGGGAMASTLVPLQAVVTAEEVTEDGLLNDQAVQEQLLPTLPAGNQTVEELQATVHSPQYQQTLASLTSALQSENYNSIFANFGLDPAAGAEALARGNGVEAFVAAINAQAGSGGGGGSSSSSSSADAAAAATPPSEDKMDEEPKKE